MRFHLKALALITCLLMLCGNVGLAQEENPLPIVSEPTTLTMYMQLFNGVEQLVDDYNQLPTVQKLEELTGIHIDFINPPVGDDGTFFNMLVASGDYPDIFVAQDEIGRDYPGGMDGAIEDGIIINHNELVEQYAPNYMAQFNGLDEIDQLKMKSDAGVYKLSSIGSNIVNGKQHTGLIIRKDWLDALGLEAPTTFAEFENVLRAFQENYETTVPFAFAGFSDYFISNGAVFTGGHHVTWNTFVLDDEGKVSHSYLQPGYRDLLEMLTAWMTEGLINVDNINRSHDDCKKLLYTGQTGVIGVGNWETVEVMELGALEDENFVIVPLSVLRKEGDDGILGYSSPLQKVEGAARYFVSTGCEDPVTAIKWIDNLYKPEINLLNTFGVGDLGDGNSTYVIDENGEYAYSDYLHNHPDYTFATIRSMHYVQSWCTNTLDSMELSQYNQPIHQECWRVWSIGIDNSRLLPGARSKTSDEDRTSNEIMGEIQTYMSEVALKIICGEEGLEAWDAAVEGLEDMGIYDAIAAEQAAVDRFNAR